MADRYFVSACADYLTQGQLIEVDATGGIISTIGNTVDGLGNDYKIGAMVFDDTPTLWGITTASDIHAGSLVTIDPATALVTPVDPTFVAFNPFVADLSGGQGGDLTVIPATGQLYQMMDPPFYGSNQGIAVQAPDMISGNQTDSSSGWGSASVFTGFPPSGLLYDPVSDNFFSIGFTNFTSFSLDLFQGDYQPRSGPNPGSTSPTALDLGDTGIVNPFTNNCCALDLDSAGLAWGIYNDIFDGSPYPATLFTFALTGTLIITIQGTLPDNSCALAILKAPGPADLVMMWVAGPYPPGCGQPPSWKFKPFKLFPRSIGATQNATPSWIKAFGPVPSGYQVWFYPRTITPTFIPDHPSDLQTYIWP